MMSTGQLVMHHADMGTRIVIARDLGAYPGTRAELNVRKLEEVETIALSITHPAVQALYDRGGLYGCGWGDTGVLCPVSTEDVAALRRAVPKTELSATTPEWRSPRGKTLTEEMDDPNSTY